MVCAAPAARRNVNTSPRRNPVIGKNAKPRRRRMSLTGILARIVAVLGLAWASGFLWFSLTLPEPAPLAVKTDAVVVLTGGAGRLARGLAVLEAGSAKRMLVSGVDRRTTRKQLAAAANSAKARFATTDLGYEAIDTRSNAEETARWVALHKFSTLRLVTSAGHMRRARLELSRVLPPTVLVVSDAVPVEPKAPSIAAEYSKYLLRRGALMLGAV